VTCSLILTLEKNMTTYVTKKPAGYTRSIVVRTEESRQRAAHRAVLRTPSFIPRMSAQDAADEQKLSRSKEYPNKGNGERARRVRQMDRLLGVDGVLTASEALSSRRSAPPERPAVKS
jgi:hypothetical protein